jgi:nucleoside-diphosphate-sugar epimerase
VHVEDLSQLTVAVAEYALKNPDKTTASASSKGWENLIYSGVDTHTWGPVIKELGDLLFARGDTSKPSAKEIAEGEGILYMFGGNSFLAPSKKAKALGFKPKQKDLVSSMRDALRA